MNNELVFYYDFSCPYAYLASTQVEALGLRQRAVLLWRPVLLGGLIKAHESPELAALPMSPAKARHQSLDVLRWARYRGVELRYPGGHPRRTVEALRLLLAAPEEAWPRLTHALYRAYWVEERRIEEPAELAAIAGEVGLDGEGLVTRLQDPSLKQALRERTDEAVARGVFGVPTFFVGEQMFWGQDRMGFVEAALADRFVPGLADLPRFGLFAKPLKAMVG
jgi:2-hydroxychromene-2-carboxylate isomerase